MTLVDDLKAAKALIDTPEKCAFAHKVDGTSLTLAIDKIATTDDRWSALSSAVQKQVPGELFVDWSWKHGRTHSDIMALFDRAIAAAEASAP